MELPLLHTHVLLAVMLQAAAGASGRNDLCVPVYVAVEETALINCSISNAAQDGVYLYKKIKDGTGQQMMYYYKDGTLTPRWSTFTKRLEINKRFDSFLLSISNVSQRDSGVYWCSFNKLDEDTLSERTCLLVQGKTLICKEECNMSIPNNNMYFVVIGGLSSIILVLLSVLVKLCYDRGKYTVTQQQPCNGVYEVMRSNTGRSLINPAYESSQRQRHSDFK